MFIRTARAGLVATLALAGLISPTLAAPLGPDSGLTGGPEGVVSVQYGHGFGRHHHGYGLHRGYDHGPHFYGRPRHHHHGHFGHRHGGFGGHHHHHRGRHHGHW